MCLGYIGTRCNGAERDAYVVHKGGNRSNTVSDISEPDPDIADNGNKGKNYRDFCVRFRLGANRGINPVNPRQ